MKWFLIAAFGLALFFFIGCLTDLDGKSSKGEIATTVVLGDIALGIIIYWTRKFWLYPIIGMFTNAEEHCKLIFLSIVLILLGASYVTTLMCKAPRILFLAIFYVVNAIVVFVQPIVALAIVFIYTVAVYSLISNKSTEVTIIELSLAEAMIITNLVFAVLNECGIKAGIILIIFSVAAITVAISVLTTMYYNHKHKNNDEAPVTITSLVTVDSGAIIIH